MKTNWCGVSRQSRNSMNLDFHRFDASADSFIERMSAEGGEVGVLGQPFEIAITQVKRAIQRGGGGGELLRQRIAASQVVVHQGVTGPQAGELLIQLQTICKPAAARIVISQNLQSFNERRGAANHAFNEPDLDVEVAFLFARQFFRSFWPHEQRYNGG